MSDSSPQLDIFFEPTEPTASTGPSQLLDRMRQRREDAVIAIGLPLSPSGKPLPNDVLRSALFAVSQKVFRRETKLASIEGVEVFISRG